MIVAILGSQMSSINEILQEALEPVTVAPPSEN